MFWRLTGRQYTKQGALIGAYDTLPAVTAIGGAQHDAHLADHKQAGIFDVGNGIQVKAIFVVQLITNLYPAGSAIISAQHAAIGTNGKAPLPVGKPDIQQGSLKFTVAILPDPVLTTVTAVQNLGIVPNSPAVFVINKNTAVNSCLVGTLPCCQLSPSLSEYST